MVREQVVWAAGSAAWLAAALGVLRLGMSADDAGSCPLDGPWG